MNYLPEIYQDFKKRFPEIARQYDTIAQSCNEWGSLDSRTRRLIKLGVSIGLHSEGAVRSHVRRALEEGLSPDEIRHAILIAFTTTGYPAMNAAMKWAEEVISKHN